MFIPEFRQATKLQLDKLQIWFETNLGSILVLTGAGISTESGIPDYRSEGVGLYARSKYRPIMFNDFLKNSKMRQRYWARNYFGWPRFSHIIPNQVHHALTKLERIQNNSNLPLITQNVDGLHKKAGTKNLIELHGTAYKIECLKCTYETSRDNFQAWLQDLNPDLILNDSLKSVTSMRPDGDFELLTEEIINSFNYPNCPKCDNLLKPEIVFFGDSIPSKRVSKVNEAIDTCKALLVLGSSLSVWSAYRIKLEVSRSGKSIAIINIGPIRMDTDNPLSNMDILINSKCGDVIPGIINNLELRKI